MAHNVWLWNVAASETSLYPTLKYEFSSLYLNEQASTAIFSKLVLAAGLFMGTLNQRDFVDCPKLEWFGFYQLGLYRKAYNS